MSVNTFERRNIVCNAVGEGFWAFGAGLASFITVLPLLIRGLGGSQLEVGLISALAAAGVSAPQILASFTLQRGQGRKRFLLWYHWVVLMPLWAGIGAVLALAAPHHAHLARVLVLVLVAAYMANIGFMLPAWTDWVAGLFRKERRGWAFGVANSAASGSAALAAGAAGLATGWLPFPAGYALLFFVGTGFYALSMLTFLPVREPAATPAARLSARGVLARLRHSLGERNFRRYLVSRLLLTLGGGATAFFAVHYASPSGGRLPERTIIALGSAVTIGQMLAGLALGAIGDALGHKLGAVVGTLAQAAAVGVVLLAPGPWSCGIAFALVGVCYASGWVSHQNLLFETCPHDSRMAHITLSSLVLAPFTAAVPLLTGTAITHLGMPLTLVGCLVPTLLGLLWLLLAVREPRTVPLRVAAAPAESSALPQKGERPED